jgi:hypothetical protein
MAEPSDVSRFIDGVGPSGLPTGIRVDAAATPDAATRRASVPERLTFVGLPPLVGSFLASLALGTSLHPVWVVVTFAVAGVGLLLLVEPLILRSLAFQRAGYRRAGELAFLGFLTAFSGLFYALVVHLLLGVREPWALDLLRLVAPGG